MYTFIGVCVLKVDHGAKSPEEAPFTERFQRSGPSASKASGLISQKRSLKASDGLNFIKSRIKRVTYRIRCDDGGISCYVPLKIFTAIGCCSSLDSTYLITNVISTTKFSDTSIYIAGMSFYPHLRPIYNPQKFDYLDPSESIFRAVGTNFKM